MMDSTLVTKLNIHMQVKQAINKLRENEVLSRLPLNDIALFIPSKGSGSSQLIRQLSDSSSSPTLQRNCNDSAAIWLDPELCLWHYGLNSGVCYKSITFIFFY